MGLLALIIAGTLALIWMADQTVLQRRIPFKKSPEILAERSREILRKMGHSEEYGYSACGFVRNSDFLNYIQNKDKTAKPLEKPGLESNSVLVPTKPASNRGSIAQ